MRPYSILVSDIDGTLLDNNGHLPAENLRALQRWVDLGLTLALASGRNFTAAEPIAQKIKRPHYLILQDGGVILHYPSLRVISCHNLNPAEAETARHIFAQNEAALMVFDPLPHGRRFSLCLFGPPSQGLKRYLSFKEGQYHIQTDISKLPPSPSKLVTIHSANVIAQLSHLLHTALPQARVISTEAARLNAVFLEVGSPLASKLLALQTLLQHLQIPLSEVIAIGDAENDIEILSAAGLGAAMANASSRAKRAANVVIGSNHGAGLARFLESVVPIS